MGIHLSITAESADEALDAMRAFLGGDKPFVQTPFSPPQATTAAPEPTIQAPADKPTRATRGSRTTKVTDVTDQNAAGAQQGIQSGAERDDPNAKAADTTAQPEIAKPKALTLDDVRAAAKPYIDKFTMAAASKDLTPCLEKATGCKAISELADKGPDVLKAAIDAFTVAGAVVVPDEIMALQKTDMAAFAKASVPYRYGQPAAVA